MKTIIVTALLTLSLCIALVLKPDYERATTRTELVDSICSGPITSFPDDIISVTDPDYDDLSQIGIDRITTNMSGFYSIAYHFHANTFNGHTVIYHQGHRGGFNLGKATISALLDSGYDVIAFNMPLIGPNYGLDRHYFDHNDLADVDHGLCLFVEPVIRTINYLGQPVYMVGISGGGWTTVLAAAMDARIIKSYPVSGSVPLDMRDRPGDWEQLQLPDVMPYRELYALAEHQLAIQNEFDPCCFSGTGLLTLDIGDNWSALVDSTHHEHKISEFAISAILADMAYP